MSLKKICNGISGVSSLAASREKAWREKCESLSAEVKNKDEVIAQKDRVIANKDQQILELLMKIRKLEERPLYMGDNVENKITNNYIYGQDGTNAARSFAGAM